jgi:hypothetical protein
VLHPTVYGGLYAPREGGTFFGGGLEVILMSWSDNSEAFGPSQGRVRIDVGLFEGTMDAGSLVMYRMGTQLAFERNASRDYLIPYFAGDFGGLWTEATGRRWFADAGLGLYLLYRRNVVIDVEVTGVLPFREPERLAGITSRLGLSFSLW